MAALEVQCAGTVIAAEAKVAEVAALRAQLAKLRAEARRVVAAPRYALPFLQTGRLVQLPRLLQQTVTENGSGSVTSSREPELVWGAVVNFERVGCAKAGEGGGGNGTERDSSGGSKKVTYLVDVLVNATADSATAPRRPELLPPAAAHGVPLVVPVALLELAGFSSVRVYVPKDLRAPEVNGLKMDRLF